MTTSDDQAPVDDPDAVRDQVRDKPNLELVHQHEEDRDPLDLAIMAEHERVIDDEASPVQEGRLNPPPVDESD